MTVAPAPDLDRPHALFARAYRATGYCRLGLGIPAAGNVAGKDITLVVPIDQVVAVDARTRMTGGSLSLTVQGPGALSRAAHAAAQALLEDRDLRGDVRLTVRPSPGATGTDSREAAAVAAIDAIARAEELTVPTADRVRLLRLAGITSTGLVHGAPGLIDAQGGAHQLLPASGRLLVVLAAPVAPASAPPNYGNAIAAPEISGPHDFARWLSACVGHGSSDALNASRTATAQHSDALAVIGGYGEQQSVAALLPGGREHLTSAQRLSYDIRARLGATWRVGVVQTAAPANL